MTNLIWYYYNFILFFQNKMGHMLLFRSRQKSLKRFNATSLFSSDFVPYVLITLIFKYSIHYIVFDEETYNKVN